MTTQFPAHPEMVRVYSSFGSDIAALLKDQTLTEVMIIPNGSVFTEGPDGMQQINIKLDPDRIRRALQDIASSKHTRIDASSPVLRSRLPDGSRLTAVLPPASPRGPLITIRKHTKWYSLDQLVELEAMPKSVADFLFRQMIDRRNIILSGETGSGKTTIVKACIDLIPKDERIGVIENPAELQIDHPHWFGLEASPETAHLPGHSYRELVQVCMSSRPDRLILGEVIGPEAWDLLNALNTGHRGSLSTIHANSCLDALYKLVNLTLQAGQAVNHAETRRLVSRAIHCVVQMGRVDGKRRVLEVATVSPLEYGQEDSGFRLETEYSYQS